MNTTAYRNFIRRHNHCAVTGCLRCLIIVACVGLFGIIPAFGQSAEYSDTYTIDRGTNGEQAVDPETGESLSSMPDSAGTSEQVGVGVSEDDYDSTIYSTETTTTVTSPSGRVLTTGYADGYTYARAEALGVYLTADSEQGDYMVNSTHKYYYDRVDLGGCQPGMICTASNSDKLN